MKIFRRSSIPCFFILFSLAILVAFILVFPPAFAVEAVSTPVRETVDANVEAVVKAVTLYLARFVETAAAIVIGIASLKALYAYFTTLFKGNVQVLPKEEIRLSLGRSLALALEFELGADILKTAVAPTWNDIGLLAAIAVLRTALNYFLEKELRNAAERSPNPPDPNRSKRKDAARSP